jgi:hypothetical protein
MCSLAIDKIHRKESITTLDCSNLGRQGKEGHLWWDGGSHKLSSRSGKVEGSRACLEELSSPQRQPLGSSYHLTLSRISLFESSGR